MTDQKETGLVRRLEYSYHAHNSGNCFIASWSNGACLVVKVFPAPHTHTARYESWSVKGLETHTELAKVTITFYVYPLNVVVCPQ